MSLTTPLLLAQTPNSGIEESGQHDNAKCGNTKESAATGARQLTPKPKQRVIAELLYSMLPRAGK